MRCILLAAVMLCGCATHRTLAPLVAPTAPPIASRPVLTIHVQKGSVQRALDEKSLMELLRQDFQNMDMSADQVDLKIRRQMDALMKRLMTDKMWVEP